MSDMKLGDDDWGFTAMREDEVPTANDERRKLLTMYMMITPFIANLLKDADTKPVIHWPNRKKKLEEFRKKLDELVEGVPQD